MDVGEGGGDGGGGGGGGGAHTPLKEDEVVLDLAPGPPSMLAFDGPQTLQCGTRGVLGDLAVRVTDDWGNTVDADKLEVSLQSSAIAADGHAAKVAVQGGSNRAKVKKGLATWKGVGITAEVAGVYTLRASSATRKYAVRDAAMSIEVCAQNLVTHLELAPVRNEEAAGEGEEGSETTFPAGAAITVQAHVETEDGCPLPADVAASSLVLKVMPPGITAAADAILLAPNAPDPDASQASRALVSFTTPPLTVAGTYTATLEYTESRQHLLRALGKAGPIMRSSSQAWSVAPGAICCATLETPRLGSGDGSGGGGCSTDHVVLATNGCEQAQRRLLQQVAVQLRDEYGNAVAQAGVPIRWTLSWQDKSMMAEGHKLPEMCAQGDGGECMAAARPRMSIVERVSDEAGRGFFGELCVVEGTGRVALPQEGEEQQDEPGGGSMQPKVRLISCHGRP